MRLLCNSCDKFSIKASKLGDGTEEILQLAKRIQGEIATRNLQSKHSAGLNASTFTSCSYSKPRLTQIFAKTG